MSLVVLSNCPLCKKDFCCGVEEGASSCWCYNYEKIELSLDFDDQCVCEECLKKEIGNKELK